MYDLKGLGAIHFGLVIASCDCYVTTILAEQVAAAAKKREIKSKIIILFPTTTPNSIVIKAIHLLPQLYHYAF